MTTTPAAGIDWQMNERGTGRPLLLLHGFTGAAASWEDHLDALAAGRRVIAPDLPGHGATPAPPEDAMTVEATADALADLLARLNAVPSDVLGYSLGARIALRLSIAHPDVVGRLVLESPSAGIADPAARAARHAADEQLADRIERDGTAAFVTAWERSPVFASHAALAPDVVERQRAIRLAGDPVGLAASLRAAGQGSMQPLQARLAEVAAPVLVITGALDTVAGGRALEVAAGIPRARLARLDNVGHTPHLEAPDVFARLVIDFLEEQPA